MSTFSDLESLGTSLSSFNQGSFRGNTTQVYNKSITNGYCAGVCLDWMRRVLLSNTNRDQKFLGYKDIDPSRTGATVKRMGFAYKEQAATYVSETNLKQAINMLALLRNGVEKTYNINGSPRTGVPIPNNQAKVLMELWVLTSDLNLSKEPAGVLSRTTLNDLYQRALVRQDPQKRALTADGRDWTHLSEQLDNEFTVIRLGESRQITKKSFSSVQVRKSSILKQYNSGGAWAAELENNAFAQNCCTILSFHHNGGGSGHAVAVHVTAGGDYRFFDPNFGTFKYTLENLMKALQHLFWTPYFQVPSGSTVLDGNKAIYLRRNQESEVMLTPMNKVGYTIFERKSDM